MIEERRQLGSYAVNVFFNIGLWLTMLKEPHICNYMTYIYASTISIRKSSRGKRAARLR